MAWKTTKDGRHFNTDWIDEDTKRKEEQIQANKHQADSKNGKKSSTSSKYEDANRMYHATYRGKAGDINFEKALQEYSNEERWYDDYISEEIENRGGTPEKNLYRGMSFSKRFETSYEFFEQQLKNAKEGDIIKPNQLTSFDKNESKAKQFAEEFSGDLEDKVMLHLIDNKKALDISPYSTSRQEKEYLAPASVEYIIIKRYMKNDILYFDIKEKK